MENNIGETLAISIVSATCGAFLTIWYLKMRYPLKESDDVAEYNFGMKPEDVKDVIYGGSTRRLRKQNKKHKTLVKKVNI